VGNDYGYASIFERQVEALAKKGDVLIGISTSGNSENVVRAFEKGKAIGTFNISPHLAVFLCRCTGRRRP